MQIDEEKEKKIMKKMFVFLEVIIKNLILCND